MEMILDLLVTIQELDDNIKTVKSRIDKLPQIIASLEGEIKKTDLNLTNKKNRLQEIRKKYKLNEAEIADNEAKFVKLDGQTFAVKTNEEYRAILTEINYIKKQNKKIEDKMIDLLEEEEKLKEAIASLEDNARNLINKKREEIELLKKEEEDLVAKQRLNKAAFEENFHKLPDDLKKTYTKIKKARGNAVCFVSNNACTGCYANLTHQFINELKKRDRMLLCDSCGRILVFKK